MIKTWHPNITDKEAKDIAYWERNMLALLLAVVLNATTNTINGWYRHDEEGYEGFSRVISLMDGKITFHVPDDFDLGSLPEIKPNWDGHTTEEKWRFVAEMCGVNLE